MYKKTLLSLAVASSMTLTGCIGSTESGDDEVASDPNASTLPAGAVYPLFDPAAGSLPIPNDLLFDSEQGDGTFGVDDTSPPVTTALNELSGASTVAPAVIQFNGTLDASTVVGSVDQDGNDVAGAALATQTVFLIELDYASGDPVQGLGNREAPTVSPNTANLRFRADVETLSTAQGAGSAIRILPLEPLDPGKRYVAVVTNEVLTQSQEPIVSSVPYSFLTDEDNVIGGALATVQTLINRIWEATAVGYFDLANNQARPGNELTADNIAISYSFTTSKDDKVLQYIAEPASWFSDQISNFLRVSATKKLTGAALLFQNQQLGANNDLPVESWDLNDDGVVDALDFDRDDNDVITPDDFLIDGDGEFGHNELLVAADEAENGFPNTLPPNPNSPLNQLFASGGPCEITGPGDLGGPSIDCVATALASQFSSQLPTPLPGLSRNVPDGEGGFSGAITIDSTTISPVGLVSAVASSIPDSGNVIAAQGSVSLPYYLGSESTNISGANALNWTADSELATSLNETFAALGLEIPQADPSRSTAVNYLFPFPEQQSTQEVPLLALYPNSGAINGVVMYQHGITTDRSSALTFGTALAAQGFAVIAIDQPLHGVTPFSLADQVDLAGQLLTAAPTLTNDQATRDAVIGRQLSVFALMNIDQACAAIDVDFGDSTSVQAAIATVIGGGCEGDVPGSAEQMASAVSLENTVANAGSTIPGLAPRSNERHFGLFSANDGSVAQMVFDRVNPAGDEDTSGDFYINLQNFLTARDNNRQSIVDQMNLRVSLFGIPDQDTPANTVPGVTLPRPMAAGGPGDNIVVTAADPVYFGGHSLGTLTGMPFVASVNENQIADTIYTSETFDSTLPSSFNDIQAASMLTPGGGIVRILENSTSIAPGVVFGLSQANNGNGPTQGTAALESFLNVAQAALDSADPINFAERLGNSTSVLLSEVSGDLVIPNAADQAEWGTPPLNATLPLELPNGNTIQVEVNSFPAPLSGSQPLKLGLGDMFTTYNAGDHSTPTSANNQQVFGGMVCETLVTFGVELVDLPAFCSGPN